MRAISFTLRCNVTEPEKEKALEEIRALQEVVSAVLLLTDAEEEPNLARMGYAYVDDATDAAAMTIRIRAIPNVESALIAGNRYLR